MLHLLLHSFDHSQEPLHPYFFHVNKPPCTQAYIQAKAGGRCIIHINAIILSNWGHWGSGCLQFSVEIVLIIIGDLCRWSEQTSRWCSPSEGQLSTERSGQHIGELHCMLASVPITFECKRPPEDIELYVRGLKNVQLDNEQCLQRHTHI